MITWTNLHEEAYQALVFGRSGDAEYIYRMSRGAISESSFRAIKYKASQHPRNQILSKLSQLDVEGAKQLYESNPGCIEQILYDSCLAKAVQEKQRLAVEGIWEEITEALRLREFPKAQTLCALLPATADNERRYLLLYEQAISQVRSEQKGKITHLLLDERELDADALYERKASKWWAREAYERHKREVKERLLAERLAQSREQHKREIISLLSTFQFLEADKQYRANCSSWWAESSYQDELQRYSKRSPPCSVNVNFPEIYAAAKISMS